MAAQILKYTTVRCCKLLLLFLLWNEVATVNGTGSESPTLEHNYPKVINERIKRDVSAVGDVMPLLPDDCKAENNNEDSDKDKHGIPFSIGTDIPYSFPPVSNPLRTLNIVKRAPSGFTGVRGKKEYEFTDNSNNYNNANKQTILGDSGVDWTIDPIQQQQVAYNNELNTEYGRLFNLEPRFKKAPSTFYGVRGKKLSGSDLQGINALLQRLEEDNLRETMQRDFLNYLVNQQLLSQNDIIKRAPTGFTGMRGKRPSAGVIDYLYNGDDETWPVPMLDEKRGPVNGFMGVRGKKAADHQAFKRSPIESPNRRSKVQRFVDFNNKFVAVRGKKANSESDNNSNTFADETYHSYNNNNKLPLMSQLSMRGKRAIVMPVETDQASYELAVEDSRTFNN